MKPARWALLGLGIVAAGCSPVSEPKTKEPTTTVEPASPASIQARQEARQYRLQWNRDTLVGDYERHGSRSAKWDESARQALETFAKLRTEGPAGIAELMPRVAEATALAITNGCDDPMVKYLYARFVLPQQQHEPESHAQIFRSLAEELSRSQRAPIRKFYPALRAADASNVGSAAAMPEVQRWRNEANRFLTQVAEDKTTPAAEVSEACEAFFLSIPKKGKESYEYYLKLDPVLFKNWPAASSLYLLKGWLYTDFAWEARGNGIANTVTDSGWSGFEKRLGIAEEALNRAWELDPTDARIARRMITVELGQGQGRDRMEKWFQRAMALNTNYYDACYAKLYYLEPKWHGSRDEMFEFALECLRSEKWGGNVPLIVVDAHESVASSFNKSDRTKYWKRPEVWKDVKEAFDKFFRLNPKAEGWHHNYALFAYRAEQWAELNRQLALLGPVNYSFFGGKEEFDKMVQAAQQHPTKAN